MMVKIFYDAKEVVELQNFFFCCDYLSNGVITEVELIHLFEQAKETISQAQARKIIGNLYLRTENVVTFTEFIAGLLPHKFFTDKKRL